VSCRDVIQDSEPGPSKSSPLSAIMSASLTNQNGCPRVVSPPKLAMTDTGTTRCRNKKRATKTMTSSQSTWSDPVSNDEAHARAAGRRQYNETRSFEAMMRSAQVIGMLNERGFARGVQAQIARELGVARSTVSRDVMRALAPDRQPCRTCERPMSVKQWNRLNKKRATQQRGRATSEPKPSEWLQVVLELRKRGMLQEEDEQFVEDDLGC
jgi:hypothetical protein